MDPIENTNSGAPAADPAPTPENPTPGNPADTANTDVGGQGADEKGKQEDKAPSILGNQKEGEGKPGEEPAGDVQFDFSELGKEMGADMNDPSVKEFANVLNALGIKDNQTANDLAKFGMQYAIGQIESYRDLIANQKFEEAHKAFGSTPENPSESFKEVEGMAGKGLAALEAKVPGFVDAIIESGMDNDVRALKAFALIGEMVGEDGNVLRGNSPAQSMGLPATAFFDNTK